MVDKRCQNCFLLTYQRLFEKFNVASFQREYFLSFFQEIMVMHDQLSSPEIQRELNNKLCQIIGNTNPYLEEKISSNRIAHSLYNEWKPKISASADPFDLALRLSIAGNIMDYGANVNFDIYDTIDAVLKSKFAIDHSIQLQNKIKQAKSILYLGDNAGEIVFDKLFIETQMQHVTFSVKSAPILNDVTIEDAKEAGMDLVAKVISNGYDAPSTVLHKCSKEFLDIYNSADLIISKGQGNFEGLMREKDPRLFFLLMAKCDVVAEILNVIKGSFVVYNQSE